VKRISEVKRHKSLEHARQTRVGHGSGPSMDRVGSGQVGSRWVTKFSVLGWSGWVRSSVKKI